ncbi:metal-dependent hydrolase [Candidatus Woesearchaeota archaeon]|nr:metal-dependent hydrolase [Candidatus Woesearchaeota archaeon]
MLFKTHLVFSLLIGLLTYNYFKLNYIIFILIILFTGILPDIDHPKSKLGRKLKILSYPINFIFGHRGLFHSLFIALSSSFLIWIIFGDYYIPFFIGFLSHLIADGITKQGIDFTYPFNFFKVTGMIKTGSFIEKVIFLLLIVINGYLIFRLIF